MAITALSHRAKALRNRILRCFNAVSVMDKKRRAQAESELALAKAHMEKGERAAARRYLSNVLAHAWENGLAWRYTDKAGSIPLHARAWEFMAKTYFDEGEDEKGEKCLEAARLAAAEVKSLDSGIKGMESGRYEEAVKKLAEAERVGKEYSRCASRLLGRKVEGGGSVALLSLGYAYMLAGDLEKALGEIDRALARTRSNFEAWAAKASALDAKGEEREAEKWYSKVQKGAKDA